MSVKATLLAGITSSVLAASPGLPAAEGGPLWSRGMKDISTEIIKHDVMMIDGGMDHSVELECGCSVILR